LPRKPVVFSRVSAWRPVSPSTSGTGTTLFFVVVAAGGGGVVEVVVVVLLVVVVGRVAVVVVSARGRVVVGLVVVVAGGGGGGAVVSLRVEVRAAGLDGPSSSPAKTANATSSAVVAAAGPRSQIHQFLSILLTPSGKLLDVCSNRLIAQIR
jgi:hypothetical protein